MDECELCGGTGQVEIFTDSSNQLDYYGCPVCIQAEKDDEITTLRAKVAELGESLAVTRTANSLQEVMLHKQAKMLSEARAQLTEAQAKIEAAGKQNPVAYRHVTNGAVISASVIEDCRKKSGMWQPLFTAPPITTATSSHGWLPSAEWKECHKLPVTVHVRKQRPGETHVSTREGITPVKPDDLIMRGVSGEEYPIGRAIFEQTYRMGALPTAPRGTEKEG